MAVVSGDDDFHGGWHFPTKKGLNYRNFDFLRIGWVNDCNGLFFKNLCVACIYDALASPCLSPVNLIRPSHLAYSRDFSVQFDPVNYGSVD